MWMLLAAALASVAVLPPAPVPPRWAGLVGEYGPDEGTLYVRESDGRLEVVVKGGKPAPLVELSKDMFRLPASGPHASETITFVRDASGRAASARVGASILPRRAWGIEGKGTFRVAPSRPVAELLKEAAAASPPTEPGPFRRPDLVDLTNLDPTIKLDIRYATDENFLGTPVYDEARAYLQRPAAEALRRAHRRLKELGYGLLIHDAYRPWSVTKVFWEATPPDKRVFVADPTQGSRHNRGCAVDLTLYRLADGRPVEMPGVYDEMSERSYADFPGGTSEERWYRQLLRGAMRDVGFAVYEAEWWHFDYKDWRRYPILNLPFAQLHVLDK